MSTPMETTLVVTSPPNAPSNPSTTASSSAKQDTTTTRRIARKPGRPATYVFDKPDDELTEKERKQKVSIEKRRIRQNRSYHRRKAGRKFKKVSSSSTVTINPNHLLNTPTPIATSATFQQTLSLAHPSTSQPWHLNFPPPHVPSPSHAITVINNCNVQSMSPSTTVTAVGPPKFIADFSQNPLDLLASATADRALQLNNTVGTSPLFGVPDMSGAHPNYREDGIDSDNIPARHNVVSDVASTPSNPLEATRTVNEVSSTPVENTSDYLTNSSAVEETLEIDATASAMETISSYPLPLHVEKISAQHTDGKPEDPTDVLVKSAMVAAKEYAKSSCDLKDVMDRETELRRMTGIRTIVFENLRAKYLGMSADLRDALRHFIIFPRSFDLHAAAAVAGIDNPGDSGFHSMQGMLNSMIQTNFLTTAKGRYELNVAARLFLTEDSTVMNDSVDASTYDVAQKRFISHYQQRLSRLQDDEINRRGWVREQAMALYDCERENMEFSEFLLNGRNDDLRAFLSAGITVMRYCVSALNRERMLQKALSEDETSTEDIFLSFPNVLDQSSNSDTRDKSKDDDKSHRARLHLALSEAYFDQLKLKEAEKPLQEALKLMGNVNPKQGTSSNNIIDSVLVLLLIANLRMTERRVKEARQLCVKALKILAEAGLGRSTFGINAMSNLVSIYLMEGHLDKAKSVADRLLNTLNVMSYTGMPIYADALGVCAMVSMAEGKFREAEKQYDCALETVGKWGSKEWTGIPVQHCLDLDLWLMEGLAESMRRQGKVQDALVLEQQAAKDRHSRGLPQNTAVPQIVELNTAENQNRGTDPPPSLRHLY